MVTADQTIYHNAEYPPHIVLPNIGREDQKEVLK